jgi:uncharacterized protein YggE
MNSDKLYKHPVFTLIVFFLLLFVYSKFGPDLPISVISQQKGEPLIVTETGKATAIPDIAKITFGIEESSTSLTTALNSVNSKSKTLLAALKKLGVEEKDIKTINYSVYPNYDHQSQPPKVTGYRVSTRYSVKIKDFDKVNEAITSATSSGANMVGNVSFEVNEETKNKALASAREEAVNKAREKAQSLAKAAGISLGKIINISEGSEIQPPYPLAYERAIDTSVGETVTQPEIAPGESEFSVTVSVSWQIR